MKIYTLAVVAILFFLQGCETYGKVLKATDPYTPIAKGMFGEDYGKQERMKYWEEKNKEYIRQNTPPPPAQ